MHYAHRIYQTEVIICIEPVLSREFEFVIFVNCTSLLIYWTHPVNLIFAMRYENMTTYSEFKTPVGILNEFKICFSKVYIYLKLMNLNINNTSFGGILFQAT